MHTIDHPDGRILVDTGMVESHPDVEDPWQPRCYPERIPRDVLCVINTHLHFDHCGGNVLFPDVPIHVQARELRDARTRDDYTVREWVDPPGVRYVEHDGEVEILPGIVLIPTPGHTDGHQSVLVEGTEVVGGDVAYSFRELGEADTDGEVEILPGIVLIPTPGHTDGHQSVLVRGTEVVGGDVAYSFRELGEADTDGKRRVLELALPTWLAHVERPHVPVRN